MTADRFDFWQDHSVRFLEMAFRTDKRETIEHPDGYGKNTGECGDTVELFLMLRDGCIVHAAYETDGCLHTNACANTVVAMIEGKPLENAWQITPEMVALYLQTLPLDHFHCAELAVGALYQALSDARHLANASWQKAYRHHR